MSTSPAAARRRPCVLRVDGGGGQRATTTTTTTRPSSVDRLLADIAYQWQRERRRVAGRLGRRRRCNVMTTSLTETTAGGGVVYDQENDDNCEAASAYWWTDVFLRYFVFDDDNDGAKSTVAADSDDLLFFVRRRRRRRDDKGCDERRLPSGQQRRRRIAYDTRAYRKQQHQRQHQQQPTLLPIGDPTVLWRHTVCLNAIVHRLRYTLTVAVCVHVPRRTTAAGTELCYGCGQDAADFGYDEEPDQEYDLQLLSRYVHTVYASTSGRRMDAAKGPRERPVYPAVCWAADDYAEAFRTVIVRPGQTVCAELVAAWPGPSTVVEEHESGGADEDCDDCSCEEDGGDRDDGRSSSCRRRKAAVSVRQKQNRAVLFAAAVPYAAVRATYECKMSVYREAERQRRKRHKRDGGKKSSLGAALSASLTALFTGAKDSSGVSRSPDGGDFDYYYGTPSSTAADRVEYVTVRGRLPGCDVGWSSDNEDANFDSDSVNSDACNGTKGLAQMAVTLAPVQPTEPLTPSREYGAGRAQQYCAALSDGCASVGDGGGYEQHEYCEYSYGGGDDCRQQRPHAVESPSPYAASEPGDFYDYGWDYETAASSGHQTPQTPTRHYQRRQLDRQRRRRHRRLSDPCSTSVYDLLYGQPERAAGGRQRRPQQHVGYGQHQPGGYGSDYRTSAAATPETPVLANRPHRAWSESEGLDRCGGGLGFALPGKQQQRPAALLPPPPVPYYCAAEAAASGFTQFVHKSPGGWWARQRNRRLTGRGRRERSHQMSGTAAAAATNRRRSASAGGNGGSSCCCTDDDRSGGSDADGDGGCSNSDDADSDGEFIGALAAAAAVGHDPDREWEQLGAAGDPVADWERLDSDSADSAAEPTRADAAEWTTEIVATDLRRRCPVRNESMVVAPSRTTTALDYDPSWCGGLSPVPPASSVTINHQQQQQQQEQCAFNGPQPQQRYRRPPPPQFRPQPLEPPPPPPALSVAFTAVACPWWTVLEDVLLVTSATTNPRGSFSTSGPGFPLLTFD